jgi:exodeoxyribonuclease V alpha subunit
MDDGHCGLPTDELLSLAERLLEVPVELVQTALGLELTDGTVVSDTVGETGCVFLAGLHRAERNIADRLLGLSGGSLPWPWIDPDKALPWVDERLGLTFADSQTTAIRQALPGSGCWTTAPSGCLHPRGVDLRVPGRRYARPGLGDEAAGEDDPG